MKNISENNARRPAALLSLTASLCLLFSVLLFPLTVQAEPGDYQAEAEARKEMTVESNERENWPTGPALGARSAILMEARTGAVLYEKNIHDQLYPASITKILTALIAMEQCQLDEMITYSHEAVDSIDWQTDSNIGIRAGEQINLEQSLYGLLVGSANEVANALAEHISGSVPAFAQLMNQRARKLGCVDSHFVTANGIHDDDHYTSVHDMALIAREFFSHDLLCKMSSTAAYTIPRSSTLSTELNIQCRNQLLPGREYAYEYLVGSKTGYTSLARQTLVSCAQKDGMKLICVIMMEESPAQFTDTIELFNYGFSNFHMVNVADEDDSHTVGSSGFFETDNDVFGSSETLLVINPDDVIILPNTAEYEDADAVLNYEAASDERTVAVIDYSYNGIPVGSASVRLTQLLSDPAGAVSDSADEKSGRIYINIIHVTLGMLVAFAFLYFLFWFISVIRNYSFSGQRRDQRRRKKRRKKSVIDFDRYTKGPDDF